MHKLFTPKKMIALTIFFVCFIFWNSFQPGNISSSHSNFVTDMTNMIVGKIIPNFEVSTFFIRKAAHFTEYFILGGLLMGCLIASRMRVVKNIVYPLFFGLLVPVLDETIQLFTPNRSGEVRDVLIDYSGVLAAIILSLVIIKIVEKGERKDEC